MNTQKSSNKELEDVVRQAGDVATDPAARAQLELDLRRRQHLFERQEEFYNELRAQLDTFTKLFLAITRQPVLSALLASLTAVVIGVLINLISAYLKLKCGLLGG